MLYILLLLQGIRGAGDCLTQVLFNVPTINTQYIWKTATGLTGSFDVAYPDSNNCGHQSMTVTTGTSAELFTMSWPNNGFTTFTFDASLAPSAGSYNTVVQWTLQSSLQSAQTSFTVIVEELQTHIVDPYYSWPLNGGAMIWQFNSPTYTSSLLGGNTVSISPVFQESGSSLPPDLLLQDTTVPAGFRLLTSSLASYLGSYSFTFCQTVTVSGITSNLPFTPFNACPDTINFYAGVDPPLCDSATFTLTTHNDVFVPNDQDQVINLPAQTVGDGSCGDQSISMSGVSQPWVTGVWSGTQFDLTISHATNQVPPGSYTLTVAYSLVNYPSVVSDPTTFTINVCELTAGLISLPDVSYTVGEAQQTVLSAGQTIVPLSCASAYTFTAVWSSNVSNNAVSYINLSTYINTQIQSITRSDVGSLTVNINWNVVGTGLLVNQAATDSISFQVHILDPCLSVTLSCQPSDLVSFDHLNNISASKELLQVIDSGTQFLQAGGSTEKCATSQIVLDQIVKDSQVIQLPQFTITQTASKFYLSMDCGTSICDPGLYEITITQFLDIDPTIQTQCQPFYVYLVDYFSQEIQEIEYEQDNSGATTIYLDQIFSLEKDYKTKYPVGQTWQNGIQFQTSANMIKNVIFSWPSGTPPQPKNIDFTLSDFGGTVSAKVFFPICNPIHSDNAGIYLVDVTFYCYSLLTSSVYSVNKQIQLKIVYPGCQSTQFLGQTYELKTYQVVNFNIDISLLSDTNDKDNGNNDPLNSVCGQQTISVTLLDGSNASWFSLQQQNDGQYKLFIYADKRTDLLGFHTFTLQYKIALYDVHTEINLPIRLCDGSCTNQVNCQEVKPINLVAQPRFNFKPLTQEDVFEFQFLFSDEVGGLCSQNWEYDLFLDSTQQPEVWLQIKDTFTDDFIQLTFNSPLLTLWPKRGFTNTFDFRIDVLHQSNITSFFFEVFVDSKSLFNYYKPVFQKDLNYLLEHDKSVKKVDIREIETNLFEFGPVFDQDGNQVTCQLQIEPVIENSFELICAEGLLGFNPTTLIQQAVQKGETEYDVKIILTDDAINPLTNEYGFILQVPQLTQTEALELINTIKLDFQVQTKLQENSNQYLPYFSSIQVSQVGLVEVTFSEPLKQISKVELNEKAIKVQLLSNEDDAVLSGQHRFLLQLQDKNRDMIPLKTFDWRVKEVTSTNLLVQLRFDNPYDISSAQKQDQIAITCLDPSKFESRQSNFQMRPYERIYGVLPKQLTEREQEFIQALTLATSASATASISVKLVLSLLFSGYFAIIWDSINAVQIISYQTYLNVDLPSNCYQYFNLLIDLAEFDFLPLRNIQEFFFPYFIGVGVHDQHEVQALSSKYEDRRLQQEQLEEEQEEKSDILDTIGNFLLAALLIPVLLLFLCILRMGRKIGVLRIVYFKIKNLIFWNETLRFILESYISMTIVALSQLYKGLNWADSHLWTSNLLTVFTFIFALIFPFLFTVFLRKRRHQWKEKSFKMKFSEVVQFYSHRRISAANYILIFCYRRFILAYLIVFMINQPNQQIMLNVFTHQCVIILFGYSNPFTYRGVRQFEFFNEICIIMTSYSYFTFTQYVDSAETRHQVGYFLMFTAAVNLGINLLAMNLYSVKEIHSYSKKKFYKKYNRFKTLSRQANRKQSHQIQKSLMLVNEYQEIFSNSSFLSQQSQLRSIQEVASHLENSEMQSPTPLQLFSKQSKKEKDILKNSKLRRLKRSGNNQSSDLNELSLEVSHQSDQSKQNQFESEASIFNNSEQQISCSPAVQVEENSAAYQIVEPQQIQSLDFLSNLQLNEEKSSQVRLLNNQNEQISALDKRIDLFLKKLQFDNGQELKDNPGNDTGNQLSNNENEKKYSFLGFETILY